MKSDSISIDNQGSGFEAALSQTEAAAKFRGLNDREALRLRILTEELLGMVKSITGQMTGTFWIDSEERAFTLHLSTKTKMDALKRYQFISASTENRNEAAMGFLGHKMYLQDIERKINNLREENLTTEQFIQALSHEGGVSHLAPIAVGIVLVVGYFAIVLAMIFALNLIP